MFLQLIHMKYHQVKGKEKPRLLDYGFQILQLLERAGRGLGRESRLEQFISLELGQPSSQADSDL